MADGVLIKIDGEDSGYQSKLENAKKRSVETAQKVQKAMEEANKAVQEALKATDDKVKASAEKTVKETKKAADAAVAEAKKAAEEYARLQSKSMKDTADLVSGLNKGVKTLAVAGAAAGTAVLGIGTNYNMQMEQYNAGFTTMLGNAERAGELMDDLKGFAETTPFELTDLADASTTLLAFGEDVENLMPDLKMLGDISLGNKEKFKGLALVFGQVQSQGKLMGQDLLQMINQGFNPLQIISEKTGKSMAQLKDEMADGAITYEMVADAMRTATSEGGQFFNAMEYQSKTAQGQISTLKDNVTAFFGELSEGFSEVLADDILPAAIEGVEWLTEKLRDGSIEDFFKKAATGAAGFGAALGALNVILVANDIAKLKKGVEGYTAATKLGAAAQKLFNAELLKSPYTWAGIALAGLIAAIATYAATHESATEKIRKKTKELQDALSDLKTGYEENIKAVEKNQKVEEAKAKQVVDLKSKLYALESQIKSGTLTDEDATKKKKEFANVVSQLESSIPGITKMFYDETNAIDINRTSVDNLIDAYYRLAIAKSYVNAYQSKLDDVTSRIADAEVKSEEAWETAATSEADNAKNLETAKKIVSWLPTTDTVRNELADALVDSSAFEEAVDAARDADDYLNNLKIEQGRILQKMVDYQIESEEALKAFNEVSGENDIDNPFGETKLTFSPNTPKEDQEYKKQLQERKEAYQEDRKAWEHQRKLGLISEREFYDELTKLRDRYFTETEEEYVDITQEIETYLKSVTEATAKEYADAFKSIEKERQSFAKNLESDNKAFRKITFVTGINDGDFDKEETYYDLANVGADNKVLKQYSGLLDQLSQKAGGIPELVASELKNLSPEDAVKYLNAVLTASEEEFNKYINDINENSKWSESIADKLFVDEFGELYDSFATEFGQLPEEFFAIGEGSGEQFSEGFMDAYKLMFESIQSDIMLLFSTKLPAAALEGASQSTNYTNNVYNDNRSTTINAPDSSPRGIIEAEKSRDSWYEHTGKR